MPVTLERKGTVRLALRVDLQHVHPAVFHDELDVDEPQDPQARGDSNGILDDLALLVLREALRAERPPSSRRSGRRPARRAP